MHDRSFCSCCKSAWSDRGPLRSLPQSLKLLLFRAHRPRWAGHELKQRYGRAVDRNATRNIYFPRRIVHRVPISATLEHVELG
jgi:hypothetical protein